ncbi:hypothetical protein D3C87_1176590 [compost metagenome]
MTFIAELAPVLVDASTRWNGLSVPSDTMLAVTPSPALLMASRMPCRVLLLESITTDPVDWLPSWVKLVFM